MSLFLYFWVVFRFDVLNGFFDGLLSEHGAVHLHGGQLEVVGNVAVSDLQSFLHLHALDELGRVGA